MDEYKKAIGKGEEGLSALITQYQTPDTFSLTHNLPNETLLLTEKTTVTLSNIEMSSQLFFVLLEKTKVTIGEKVSITEYAENEYCIREHGISRLALGNIERILPNSIGCSLKWVRLYNTGLINILPKLRINEDCKVEWFVLSATEKEHIAGILSQDQPICVGSVENMNLENHAVSILPKLRNHKDHEIGLLRLAADRKEYVDGILAQEEMFCVGRVKNALFEGYAVSFVLKMNHEDSEVETKKNTLLQSSHKNNRSVLGG
ncbi:MAG: uncharacterized protein A8A55_2015 [Amphiamblys sp. WSBS2006]|nr:MAG: uncharacterized protein A8A55_2015 [Amphiamblys sp. WSBS2006]